MKPCSGLVVAANACPISLLGCYGSEWFETAELDRLAHESIVFDRYYPESLQPGLEIRRFADCLSACQRSGWETACFTNLSASHCSIEPHRIHQRRSSCDYDGLEEAIFEAVDWIADKSAENAIAFVALDLSSWPIEMDSNGEMQEEPEPLHETDPEHHPSDAGDINREALTIQNEWRARMKAMDEAIGKGTARLKSMRVYEHTALAFTAFRGVHLGEQELAGMIDSPYEAAIHLPMIMKPPGRIAGRRVLEPATTQPILDWFVELMRGKSSMEPPTQSRIQTHVMFEEVRSTAVHEKKWKLVHWGSRSELFAKPEDRFDIRDVSALYPSIAASLADGLPTTTRGPD